jgi:hypothetical protein
MTSAMTSPMKSKSRPWSACNSVQTTFPMFDSVDTILNPIFSTQIERNPDARNIQWLFLSFSFSIS